MPRIGLAIGLISVAIIAGIAVGYFDFRGAFATTSYPVTTSRGISLDSAIAAFGNEASRDQLGLKDITVFDKSGGTSDGGQRQAVLTVDLPVRVATNEDEISFQYFVDTRSDMNGDNAFHCADIRLHVYVDTKKVYVSNWMGYDDRAPQLPLKTDKITIHNVPTGLKDIRLVPEGRLGGCNSGFLQSWGGTTVLFG